MKNRNVGTADRILRLIVGVILIFLAINEFDVLHYLVAFVMIMFGILFLITSFVGWSPTYAMLGYSSRRRGFEKITIDDIQRAVKENPVAQADPIEKIRATKPKANSKIKKKPVKKASSKKAAPKKAAASKKTVTKKAPTKKKPVAKKKPTKKTNKK